MEIISQGGQFLSTLLCYDTGMMMKDGWINDDTMNELSALGLPVMEPWSEPVKGEELLNDLTKVLKRFVVLPAWAAEMLALWTLHTYAFEAREVSTYIGVVSPEKRCGKTTLLSVLSQLVHRPIVSANISSSALFRVIEEVHPTLLIDEAESFLEGDEELRGILNAGYTRQTAYVVRVGQEKGRNWESRKLKPEEGKRGENGKEKGTNERREMEGGRRGGARLVRFSSWCPKVMAAIGRLPETLADRCIVVKMQRRAVEEKCERFRPGGFVTGGLNQGPMGTRAESLTALGRMCERFVADNWEAIGAAQPEIPEGLNDRAADIWEPLLALADLAEGNWPGAAREAAMDLTARAQEISPVAALLTDIFMAFCQNQAERMFSRDLVVWLNMAENPWSGLRDGKRLTEWSLGSLLRGYGVRSRTIWINGTAAKGYQRADFSDAFHRYIPKIEMSKMLMEDNESQKADKRRHLLRH